MHASTWKGSGIGGALILAAALALGGCGDAPQSKAPPAQELSETFREFGNYEVHFNALRTDTLTPDIARSYGIQRSKNRVMLNVTLLHKEADQSPRKPMNAAVQVDAYNLNGQLKNLEMRRIAPEVTAASLLESATRIGARALGFGREYGTLAAGKRAAIISVEVPRGIDDVEEYLVGDVPAASVRPVTV